MTKSTSTTIREILKYHEGFRSEPYIDTEGFLTIGYGHKVVRNQDASGHLAPRPITKMEASDLLVEDVDKALTGAYKLLREQEIYDYDKRITIAITLMCFQLGINGTRKFRKMFSALRHRDTFKAAKEMLDSRWAAQTPRRADVCHALVVASELD